MTNDGEPPDIRARLAAGETIVFEAGASLAERTVPASWIVDALVADRTVSLFGAYILDTIEAIHTDLGGHLYLTHCLLSNFRLIGCRATTRIWLKNCWLRGELNLDRTIFNDKLTIENSTLRRGLRAERAVLNEGICIEKVMAKHLFLTGIRSSSVILFGAVRVAGALRIDQSTLSAVKLFSCRFGPKSKPYKTTHEDLASQMVALRHGVTFESSFIGSTLHVADTNFNGYVSFGATTVVGNAYFERTTLGQLIMARAELRQSLTMLSTAISQAAFMNGLTVGSLCRMIACDFKTDVLMSGLKCTELTITACTFHERTLIERMSVLNSVDISLSDFHKDVKAVGTSIEGDLTIIGSRLRSDTIFANIQVGGQLIIRPTKVGDRMVLFSWNGPPVSMNFEGITAFTNSVFRGTVRVNRATFSNWVSFADSVFSSEITFASRVQDTLSFASCTIESTINLAQAVVARSLKLQDSKIDRLQLSRSLSRGRGDGDDVLSSVTDIDVSGCDYKRLEARWELILAKQLPVIPQPFVHLEKVLRSAGHDEWADQAYYRGRRVTGKSDKRLWRRIGHLFADLAFGYGVKPWNAVFFAGLIPCVAAILYVWEPNLVRPAFTGVADCKHVLPIQFFQALWLASREYIPFDFEPHGDFVSSTCPGGAIISLSLRLVGLIFIPLAVAAVSGLMKYVGSK